MLCLMISGYSLESKDELVDALPTLKKRATEDDPNILFSVASDLSKVNFFLPIRRCKFHRKDFKVRLWLQPNFEYFQVQKDIACTS